MSEVDQFLGDLNENEQDPFKNEAADPFAGQSVENKEEVEEDEKPLPFNKDPKVQRYIEKEIAKALRNDTRPPQVVERTSNRDEEDEGEVLLTRIIGNDTPEKVAAVKDFRRYLAGLEDKGAEKALSHLEAKQQAAAEEEAKASQELDDSFEAIEDQYGVDITSSKPQARKDRADFVEFIKRISPKNSDGDVIEFPDLVEAFDVFKLTRQTQPNRARELASRSLSRSSDASKVPQTQGTSWKDVDKLFSKLSS